MMVPRVITPDEERSSSEEDNIQGSISHHVYQNALSHTSGVVFYKLRRSQVYGGGNANKEMDYFGLRSSEYTHDVQNVLQTKNLGIIYDPNGKHTWYTNLAWILGVFDKKRTITLRTKLIAINIWRQDFIPKNDKEAKNAQFSAFAKEIAAAINLGYEIRILPEGGEIMLRHNIKVGKESITMATAGLSQNRLRAIDPTDVQVCDAIKKLLIEILFMAANEFTKNIEWGSALSNYIDYCKRYRSYQKQLTEDELDNFNNLIIMFNDETKESLYTNVSMLKLLKEISWLVSMGFIYQEASEAATENFINSKRWSDENKGMHDEIIPISADSSLSPPSLSN